MRLEHDLAIRREVRDILAADVALGVGDGWHQLVGRALVKIRDVTDGKVAVRQVKERHGLLSIFTNVMIRGSETVSHRVFDATNGAADESAFVCEMCGNSGRLIATDRARVRCQACEADDPERERVWRGRYLGSRGHLCPGMPRTRASLSRWKHHYACMRRRP